MNIETQPIAMHHYSRHRSRHHLLRQIQQHFYNAVHPDGAFHERYIRTGVVVGIVLGLAACAILALTQVLGTDVVQTVVSASSHVATH